MRTKTTLRLYLDQIIFLKNTRIWLKALLGILKIVEVVVKFRVILNQSRRILRHKMQDRLLFLALNSCHILKRLHNNHIHSNCQISGQLLNRMHSLYSNRGDLLRTHVMAWTHNTCLLFPRNNHLLSAKNDIIVRYHPRGALHLPHLRPKSFRKDKRQNLWPHPGHKIQVTYQLWSRSATNIIILHLKVCRSKSQLV
jgi:hypothetical protein